MRWYERNIVRVGRHTELLLTPEVRQLLRRGRWRSWWAWLRGLLAFGRRPG